MPDQYDIHWLTWPEYVGGMVFEVLAFEVLAGDDVLGDDVAVKNAFARLCLDSGEVAVS